MTRAAPDTALAGTALAAADRAAPLRLAHTDWLYHRLTVSGPPAVLTAWQHAAAGAGVIPWQLDLDQLAEDLFHRLVAPPAPQRRSLSLAGARILAEQLRSAAGRRHQRAVALVGRSRACPFDLHALLPVPSAVLMLGPDDPAALAWLWTQWGTTQALRHVAVMRDGGAAAASLPPPAPAPDTAVLHLSFWSADWTPWRAFRALAAHWPTLRFAVQPRYHPA
jgi:hypothetical protein